MVILPGGFAFILVSVSSTTSPPRGKQRSVIRSSFMSDLVHRIETALAERFGERFRADSAPAGREALAGMAAHRVCRRYQARDVAPDLVRLLSACALSAPTKSDLQQSDILIIRDKEKRHAIGALLPEMPWLVEAPVFVIFLGNGRRTPQLAALRGKPFPNDHLDLFFNATVDAAIALASFVHAAEAVGLGCCPISMIRDHAQTVSEMFALPEKVVPIAGLTLGWPGEDGVMSPRLPLSATVHEERYAETDFAATIDGYDRRRAASRPYRRQREPERFGTAEFYGWSEDKARQYAKPQRADFGAFVRRQGFKLD
jgi:nitroreductase/FMN reductase [NAD(P)H]